MSALSPVEEVNARMMRRYRDMVQIETTATGIWVTMDGEHHFNDAGKLAEALRRIGERATPNAEERG